ncbi:MAG: PH domain-containing protein [Anaerolineae bacterium]
MSNQGTFGPSPRYQVHLVIAVLICFVLFILPLAFLALVPELGWVYLLIFVIANVLWLVPTVILIPAYCRSIQYEFGNQDLLVRRGIITRSESMVPYQMVTNVEVKRGPIARALGIGSLKVHTAGYSQQAQAEASLNGLSNWEDIRQRLLDRIHQHQAAEADLAAGRSGAAPDSLEGSPSVTVLLNEIPGELRQLRAAR